MNKTKLIAMVLTVIMVATISTMVLATEIGGITIKPKTNEAPSELTNMGNNIIGIIQVIGSLIAVAMVLVIGIKYMMGSAEEKAANKKSMIPYLIGAILLFIGVNVVKIVADFAKNITVG